MAFLDRLSPEFEYRVRSQSELAEQNVGTVALRKNFDTSAAARFLRRSMLPEEAHQVGSTSERIKLGLDQARV